MMYDQKQFKSPVLLWSESEFQSHVMTLARQLGFTQQYHTHDSRRSQAGFPDLVLIHARTKKLMFVELKAQAGRVSPAQESWLNDLRLGGQVAEVWRPSDWVSGRILQVLRGGATLARS